MRQNISDTVGRINCLLDGMELLCKNGDPSDLAELCKYITEVRYSIFSLYEESNEDSFELLNDEQLEGELSLLGELADVFVGSDKNAGFFLSNCQYIKNKIEFNRLLETKEFYPLEKSGNKHHMWMGKRNWCSFKLPARHKPDYIVIEYSTLNEIEDDENNIIVQINSVSVFSKIIFLDSQNRFIFIRNLHPSDDGVTVSLNYDGCATPFDLGMGDDKRRLGMCFKSIFTIVKNDV